MLSKINHVAIVSEDYAQLAQFYIAAFGMKTSDKTRPGRAVTVRDGYVGLNINPRRAGRSAGLDHFGQRLHLQLGAHVHQVLHEGGLAPAMLQVADVAPVDLQQVQGQLLQIGQ